MVSDFDSIVHEYFDLKDKNTRRTIISLDEADQNQLLAALTSKLYDKIVEKVDDIDFGTIPRSRGDITKIENYSQLCECLDILRKIVVEYKENTYPIDVVSTAIQNMIQRKKMFMKAYTLNVEMPIITYNTITLAIVSSVSYLISGCIEYIKDPGAETYAIALDKIGYNKTSQNLLFENLSKFNEACKKGEVDLAMEDVIRNNRKLAAEASEGYGSDAMDHSTVIINIGGSQNGGGNGPDVEVKDVDSIDTKVCGKPPIGKFKHAGFGRPDVPPDAFEREPINDDCDEENEIDVREDHGILAPVFWVGKALVAIAKVIIPIIQSLVYYFYQARQDVSDYFSIQAELVQMNAYNLQYNTGMSDNDRKTVYNKQMKMANRLKSISNKFAIKYKKSEKDSVAMINDEKKKYTTDELGQSTPINTTNSGSSSVLF